MGGTFTHAVALDGEKLELIGQAQVPTTHSAPEGVARGIVQSLESLLERTRIQPGSVSFIAHSTTQATNALLEGDLAPVGIIGLGAGLEGRRAASETRLGEVPLAAGRSLRTFHRFLDAGSLDLAAAERAISQLREEGARVMVAAGAFSVDDPAAELLVLEAAGRLGMLATATHQVSGLYGLRVRTRTAAVNAGILPRMMETALMTEQSVRRAGIQAPLMIMRSDGGVMTIEEVKRRPILTILSGPAAGVAAALMFARISDGIFLEVGGTSTDISAIRNGRAEIRTAQVGGHRLYLRTLDVRTIGVAGGSMLRMAGSRVSGVGPRSAHLAGLPYAAFSSLPELQGARVSLFTPLAGDPGDYALVETASGKFAITLTCAANAAGKVPEGDHAAGDAQSARLALQAVGGEQTAARMLELAAERAAETVEQLMADYRLEREHLTLVGGGGGAGALVPAVAQRTKLPFGIAEQAPVISAIGVALALVRDSVERTVVNPTREDLLRIRREAEQAVIKVGAAPETVEVEVSVDPQQHLVRAAATGATEMRRRDPGARQLGVQELRRIAADSMGVEPERVSEMGCTDGLVVVGAEMEERSLFGLVRNRRQAVRVVDREGVIRLRLSAGSAAESPAGQAISVLERMLEQRSEYGDGGLRLPQVFLLARSRIFNLSGLIRPEQVLSLAQAELERLEPGERVVLVLG